MKKIIAISAFVFIGLLVSRPAAAQSGTGLKIDSLINFPVLPDTAYASHSYDSIQVVVHNYSNTLFSGTISVLLQAAFFTPDTLLFDTVTVHSIPAGTGATLFAGSSYHFDAVHYAAGDNIVVVWPALRVAFPIDTLTLDIHFVPLPSGTPAVTAPDFAVMPVPAGRILRLTYDQIESVEQVRIYNAFGQLLHRADGPIPSLDLSSWPPGLYEVAVLRKDGTTLVRKLLKQ
jgi:hypothetical protein